MTSTNQNHPSTDNQSTDEIYLTKSQRETMLANGYPWLPGSGKAVFLPNWQTLHVEPDIMEWIAGETPQWDSWRNTGLQLGRVVIAADNDLADAELSAKVQDIIDNHLGSSSCVRIGSKGQAGLYRVDTPIRSIVVRGVPPGGKEKKTAAEFLGLERQLMCFGHVEADPAKNRPAFNYRWPNKSPLDTPLADLPLATPADVMAAANNIRGELLAAGWTDVRVTEAATEADKDKAHREAKKSNGGLVSLPMLKDMLQHIDPSVGRKESSSWISVLGALRHVEACELVADPKTFEPDPAFDGEAVAVEWSRGDYWKGGQPSNFVSDEYVAKTFSTLRPFAPKGSTIATLVHMARDGGYRGPSRCDSLMDRFGDTPEDAPVPADPEELYNPWAEDYAPPFPLEVLPPKVRRFVEEVSSQLGADPAAMAMASIAVLSGAITHESRIHLSNTFRPRPCLWTLLVGDSGTQKTPVMDVARQPLVDLAASYFAARAKRLADLQAGGMSEADLKKEAAKPLSRPLIGNVSVEKVADILSYQNSGILLYHDELSSWIGSFDRYSNGGGGADRGFWLTARNGGNYSLDRKVSGSAHVSNLSVSILGGIQSERLREMGNLMSDGLMQRFLPVVMRKPRKGIKADTSAAIANWSALVTMLAKNKVPFKVSLSKEAEAEFDRFKDFTFDLRGNGAAGPHFTSFLMKLDGLWGNLALILHTAWTEAIGQDGVFSEAHAKLTTRLIIDFLLPHAFLFYRMMVEDTRNEDQAVAACIHKVLSSGRATIKVRELQHGTACLKKVKSSGMVDRLVPFTAGGWLIPEQEGPWCTEWKISPAVARFAAKAEKHRNDWKRLQQQWKAAGKRVPAEH